MMYCRLALEGDVEPDFDYRVGIRMRWPFPFALISCLKSEDRVAVLRDFLLPGKNTVSDWRWSDPAPVAAEHLYFLLRQLRRFVSPSAQQRW